MRRLTLLVVLVAFTFSCGGQWAVFQCVAWANMVREYSEMVPLKEAVEMTFSGRYPCAMCKMIAEKRQSENSKMLPLHKQEKQICAVGFVVKTLVPAAACNSFPSREETLQVRSDAPPTPPPRLA